MDNTKQILYRLLLECAEKSEDVLEERASIKITDVDSFLLMDFLIRVEDEFHIELNDVSKVANHMESIDDMLHYLSEMIKEVVEND